MIRTAAIALAFLMLAPEASAQAAPRAITGDWISLGDVAPVSGEEATILIGPAPPPGQTLALDPAFIVSVAKKAGVVLVIPLDQPIMVTRGGAQTAPAAKTANPARPANLAPTIGARATQPQILVLVRDVPRGRKVAEDDLGWADPAQMRTTRGLTDLDMALGMEAKRALKAGQVILASDVKAPSVVHKGQLVKLVYSSPGLQLSVTGLAQADAAKGEPVRVLNGYTKRTIDAVAEDDGLAIVARK